MKAKKTDSYFRFLFARKQWADWAVILLATGLGLVFVLLSYPLPNTISDSLTYLSAAFKDKFVAFRPFGYSFYLQLVYRLSHSIYSVVASQSLLYVLSLGMLMMAVKKYWPPRNRSLFLVFEAVVSAGPAAVYMLNTIMSDSLFCSLIFIIIAMAIVWLREGSWVALGIYALALFAAMHTRYSAMFFPLVFVPVFAFKGTVVQRIVSIAATLAVLLVFHSGVSSQMEKIVGKKQFSTGFDGWQLANNALHIFPHLEKEELDKDLPSEEMKLLRRFCTVKMDVIEDYIRTDEGITAKFLWLSKSPLKRFAYYYDDKHETMLYYDAWIALGSGLYKDFGVWYISHYPWQFVRYFLAPNALLAFFPKKLEIIGNYTDVPPGNKELNQWFTDVPADGLHARNDTCGRFNGVLVPWTDLLTWLVMLASLVALFVRKVTLSRETKICLILIFLFGLIYYGSTVFASPIAARYWMPMHAIKLSFAWIAWRAGMKTEK